MRSPLTVTFNDDGRTCKLAEDFTWTFGDETYFIPKGFMSDFASIPRAMRSIIPQLGLFTHAAILHDWNYWHQAGKKFSDKLFLKMMKDSKVPFWKRQSMYLAVKLGGHKAYKKHQTDNHTVTNYQD